MADPASPQMARNVALESARNKKVLRWVLTVLAVLCAGLLYLLSAGYDIWYVGPKAYAVGFVLSVLPVPIYVAIALFIERYEKEPIRMLAAAFFWGMSAAIFFATLFNQITYLVVKGASNDTPNAQFFVVIASAPLVEELSKGLALFILFWWKKDEFDNVIDGIVYAAMVGLGFAMVESAAKYADAFVEGGWWSASTAFLVRGVLHPFSHPLFTSMTGIGLGLARKTQNFYIRIIAPVAGLLLAVALHSLTNFFGLLQFPSISGGQFFGLFISYGLIQGLVIAGVLVVVAFSLRREGHTLRLYLAPELQSGLLSREEYDSLCSVRGRLGSYLGALVKGDFRAWRARASFNQVASELAFHRDRVGRGITSSEDAEREATFVQLLGRLKGLL